MKRILSILACVLITMIVISGCGTKWLRAYNQKDVVKYVEEIFHQDIGIKSEGAKSRSPDYYEYKVKLKNLPDFIFEVDSYVKADFFGEQAIPGTYRRCISTNYFEELMEYRREQLEKVIIDNMFKPEELLQNRYTFTVNRYSDIERVAKVIIEMDKILDFQYDNSVRDNPLREGVCIPGVTVYYEVNSSHGGIGSYDYSTYNKKLKYDDLLRSMQINYVSDMKHGELNDPTVDKSILRKIPTNIIKDLYVNTNYYGSDDEVTVIYIPEKDDYVFVTDFAHRRANSNKSIFENIIINSLGGKYDLQSLNDNEDKVSWTIGNDNYVANIKYNDHGEVSAFDVSKNGKSLNITLQEDPNVTSEPTWVVFISLGDMEKLLNVDIRIDQEIATIYFDSKK